jgi:aminoglycoside phosphotransferase (APT) family kinase protein
MTDREDRSAGTPDSGNPARPVREEDAFDVGSVAAWLREHAAEEFNGVVAGDPEVRQFPGGASNLTYLLRYPAGDLILRRPPAGTKAKSAHDMRREHDIQAALRPVFPLVARMVAFCDDPAVIGSDFYVMERLDGTIPRQDLPFELPPEETARLCESAFGVLVQLHSVDVEAAGLAGLGRGPGYVARQVAGWTDRFSRARTADTGDWTDVTTWLDAEQPADVAACVIHNDFRFDNLVLGGGPPSADPVHVVGVLDWEMATVGDPLMDLGGALAYWVESDDDEFFQGFRRQPSSAPGMWTRDEIVRWYAARRGLEVTPEQWRFYEVFGLFRLAVIAQQIWYRYVRGQTSNEAYAVFGPAVGYLESRCRRLIGAVG